MEEREGGVLAEALVDRLETGKGCYAGRVVAGVEGFRGACSEG
ncbi:MAG: hypothetical protein QW334_03565 [Thermofilum sp.]